MVRIHVFLEKTQLDFLRGLSGKVSEHIRRALDDYIRKVQGDRVSASMSEKGGVKNG